MEEEAESRLMAFARAGLPLWLLLEEADVWEEERRGTWERGSRASAIAKMLSKQLAAEDRRMSSSTYSPTC